MAKTGEGDYDTSVKRLAEIPAEDNTYGTAMQAVIR